MDENQKDYDPGQGEEEKTDGSVHSQESQTNQAQNASVRKGKWNVGSATYIWISVVCLVASLCILLTYTLTAARDRAYYSDKLAAQQAVIDRLAQGAGSDIGVDKLALLDGIFSKYSYYAGSKTEEELMTAVLKAYVAATGDEYAAYMTEEEFRAMYASNVGSSVGIGVSVVRNTVTAGTTAYEVAQTIAVYDNSPAQQAGVRVGDCIYRVKVDGVYKTASEIGYTGMTGAIAGEIGTAVEFSVLRPENGGYTSVDISALRNTYEIQTVSHWISESNPSVAIVRISSFDLVTPKQFKAAMSTLLQNPEIKHFVFDVRNNPGGDLQSIKATLTYFLQEGDLILSAVDKDGNIPKSYYAEPIALLGDYAACNVAKNEIGMYAGLDMTVLCNGNTASAAEVFTATLRDYGLATIVGSKTFGKGIMQSTLSLSEFGNYTGYLKLTTYAYVTKCGVTYHDIGILPDPGLAVELSEEAKNQNFHLLTEQQDNQLQAAIAQFNQ
ncbi:MAG: hypothetical protein IKB75_04255 [Clostridia bacterium]|nr:hypothetical protein [Clostridia bacterium]